MNRKLMENNQSLIFSVILCAFNSETTISESIESVLNQTFNCFELIIINDGSTDETLSIVKQYRKSDSRIRIYSHDNRGLGVSRNKGIELSKGKWITFIDADDMWDPEKLEKQHEIIQTIPNVDIVLTENTLLQSKISLKINKKTEYFIIDDVLNPLIKRDFNFAPATAAVKAKLFERAQFSPDKSGQDYYPFLMFALMQCVFVKIKNPLYYVRAIPNTLSRSKNSKHLGAEARVSAIRKILDEKKIIFKFDSEKIRILKAGHDRFLRWAISGARQYKTFNNYFSMTLDAKKKFYNRKYFYIEFLKTLLFPFIKKVR